MPSLLIPRKTHVWSACAHQLHMAKGLQTHAKSWHMPKACWKLLINYLNLKSELLCLLDVG